MATQVYSYLRVSGRSQIEGDGFPRQRDAINAYATAKGMEVAKEYQDKAVSGTNELEDREALSELLADAEKSGVKVILIEMANRLARDLMIQEMILAECRKREMQVIPVDAGQDLVVADDDPTRVLIRQVLGAVSQFQKSELVKKLRLARERIKKTCGRCEGVKPFGMLPGEREALERIRELRRSMKPAAIAAILNEQGIATRNGRPWNRGTVWKICTDNAYTPA
jgi:DNA invertase Pin-like site-specific DNA recombinase